MGLKKAEMAADEWVAFPGGELAGRRPKALCTQCRNALSSAALRGNEAPAQKTLCFRCYREGLHRDHALRSAADLDTASEKRFQYQLPLEPVNRPRLEMLKTERQRERAATPRHVTDRRTAQIEARHALQQIAAGLRARGLAGVDRETAILQAVHAAELQLPDTWIPFVVAR